MKTANKKPKKKSDADLQSAIVDATRLATQIAELTGTFEHLKHRIREMAVPLVRAGDNNVKIETELGICVVSLVSDHLTLAPGTDPDVLQLTLPSDLWNTFFQMKPAFRPTATDAWTRLSDEQRAKFGDPCPFVLAPRNAQVKLPK